MLLKVQGFMYDESISCTSARCKLCLYIKRRHTRQDFFRMSFRILDSSRYDFLFFYKFSEIDLSSNSV